MKKKLFIHRKSLIWVFQNWHLERTVNNVFYFFNFCDFRDLNVGSMLTMSSRIPLDKQFSYFNIWLNGVLLGVIVMLLIQLMKRCTFVGEVEFVLLQNTLQNEVFQVNKFSLDRVVLTLSRRLHIESLITSGKISWEETVNIFFRQGYVLK